MQNKSLNQIKFIASIFVVFIHTSAFRYVNKTGYVFDFIVDSLSRFGVPIFFSISGYFLYSKFKNGGNRYWFNYVKKIMWLHLWVGSVYIAFSFFDMKIHGTPIPASFFNIPHLVKSYLFSGLHVHLWYLSSLALGVTILFMATKVKMEKPLFCIAMVLNIIGLFGNGEIYAPLSSQIQIAVLGFFKRFGLFTNAGPTGFPSRNAVFFALPYLMLGYYVAQNKISEKFNWGKHKFFGIIILLFVLQVVERSLSVTLLGSSQGSNFFLTTLPLVFFILILGLKEPDLFPKLNKISYKSLDIYLWHILAMTIWTKFLRNFMNPEGILFSIIFTPLVILTVIYFPKFKKNKN